MENLKQGIICIGLLDPISILLKKLTGKKIFGIGIYQRNANDQFIITVFNSFDNNYCPLLQSRKPINISEFIHELNSCFISVVDFYEFLQEKDLEYYLGQYQGLQIIKNYFPLDDNDKLIFETDEFSSSEKITSEDSESEEEISSSSETFYRLPDYETPFHAKISSLSLQEEIPREKLLQAKKIFRTLLLGEDNDTGISILEMILTKMMSSPIVIDIVPPYEYFQHRYQHTSTRSRNCPLEWSSNILTCYQAFFEFQQEAQFDQISSNDINQTTRQFVAVVSRLINVITNGFVEGNLRFDEIQEIIRQINSILVEIRFPPHTIISSSKPVIRVVDAAITIPPRLENREEMIVRFYDFLFRIKEHINNRENLLIDLTELLQIYRDISSRFGGEKVDRNFFSTEDSVHLGYLYTGQLSRIGFQTHEIPLIDGDLSDYTLQQLAGFAVALSQISSRDQKFAILFNRVLQTIDEKVSSQTS